MTSLSGASAQVTVGARGGCEKSAEEGRMWPMIYLTALVGGVEADPDLSTETELRSNSSP